MSVGSQGFHLGIQACYSDKYNVGADSQFKTGTPFLSASENLLVLSSCAD
jgi:hypothetical protein